VGGEGEGGGECVRVRVCAQVCAHVCVRVCVCAYVRVHLSVVKKSSVN